MQKLKLFLASSFELKPERDHFEQQIYRKCKSWFEKGIFLHLDIWEDLSGRLSATGSQSEYNKYVKDADLFVLLGYTKMGMYTTEEFEKALGQFVATQKPFIFTYFKETNEAVEASLIQFKARLLDMGHFISTFKDSNDLWVQFNKELERLETVKFESNEHPGKAGSVSNTGNENNLVSDIKNSSIKINSGNTTTNTTHQEADKIFNIENIGTANF